MKLKYKKRFTHRRCVLATSVLVRSLSQGQDCRCVCTVFKRGSDASRQRTTHPSGVRADHDHV